MMIGLLYTKAGEMATFAFQGDYNTALLFYTASGPSALFMRISTSASSPVAASI